MTTLSNRCAWWNAPYFATIASAFNGQHWEPARWQWTCSASKRPDRDQRRAFEEAQIEASNRPSTVGATR